jgi:hypothetical protein
MKTLFRIVGGDVDTSVAFKASFMDRGYIWVFPRPNWICGCVPRGRPDPEFADKLNFYT